MSFGGILAQALAGGSAAIGKQAGDDLEAQRKAEMMRQQADIEEQMRMRLAEFGEKQRRSGVVWETRGEGGAAKRAYRQGELADTNAADIDKARGMIPGQQEALKAKASTEQAIAKEQAADPIYLGSIAKIKLADPEVAARIAASRASAGASSASAAESRERTEGLKLGNADKRKLDGLYGEARTILADASISDEERAKRYGKVQTQILLMKSKSGQGSTRDPELDVVTVEETTGEPGGPQTKTVRKEVRRPGQGGKAEAADPYAVPKGAAKAAGAASAPAATTKPQSGGILSGAASWLNSAVSSGSEVGNAIEAVRAKVRAGQPLTQQEQAIAKQYNLTQG